MTDPKSMMKAGVLRSEIRRYMRIEAQKYGRRLVEVEIPACVQGSAGAPFRVLRSSTHLVQCFDVGDNMIRLSCQTTDIDVEGEWVDGITWDTLQRLKAEAGYSDHEAIEIYPPDQAVVNVANIRHLFVLPKQHRMAFSWNLSNTADEVLR